MATGTDSSNPLSYELEVLTLVNNEGEGWDIRNLMLGIKIYENIQRNFLLGEIAIADSTGFLENAKIFGQESIRIRFRQPGGTGEQVPEEDVIDQVFRVYRVGGIARLGQNTLTYKLHFASPEFIHAKRIRISQALRGSMTNMAGKLALDHLGIEMKNLSPKKLSPYFEVREKSQDENFHVVVPNWTVNYAINWCCSQAQGIDSQSGLQDSFFFFQTANGGYRIQSLASMMDIEFIGGSPFAYSPVTLDNKLSYDETEKGMGMGRRILSYEIGSSANILEGIIEGLFASKQITIDNTYKYQTEKTYSYLERFYAGKGMAMNDHPMVRTLDENIYIGDAAGEGEDVPVRPYVNYDSIDSYSNAHTILQSDSHFVNDEKNTIHQASHMTHLGQTQYRTAVKQLLKYYTMNLLLPTRTDISVGQLINIMIPQARPGEAETVEPRFHSGMHLITEIMWELTQAECKTQVLVIKDSVLTNIETSVAELPDRIDAV